MTQEIPRLHVDLKGRQLDSTQDSAAIELQIDQDPEGQVDSVVLIRWCISQKTARFIQECSLKNPHLLIAVEQAGEWLDYELVPLMDEGCYFYFRRPGENLIHATIVACGHKVDAKNTEAVFKDLKTRGMDYISSLIDLDRSDVSFYSDELALVHLPMPTPDLLALYRLVRETRLSVEVPEDMFARPWRITQWLGTFFDTHRTAPARDSCQLRGRALASLPAVPMFLVLFGAATILYWLVHAGNTFLLLLIGKRGVDFDPLYSLWSSYDTPRDVWRRTKPSRWWTREVHATYELPSGYSGTRVYYENRDPVFFVINPPVILVVGGLGLLMSYISGSPFIFVLSLLSLAAVALVTGTVRSFVESGHEPESRSAKEERQEQQRREAMSRELERLTCERDGPESPTSPELRSVKLRFAGFKAKVCKSLPG